MAIGQSGEYSAVGNGAQRLPAVSTTVVSTATVSTTPERVATYSSVESTVLEDKRSQVKAPRPDATPNESVSHQQQNRYTIKAVPWQTGDYQARKAVNLYRSTQQLPTSLTASPATELLPRINEEI